MQDDAKTFFNGVEEDVQEIFDAYDKTAAQYPTMPQARQVLKAIKNKYGRVKKDIEKQLEGLTDEGYLDSLKGFLKTEYESPYRAGTRSVQEHDAEQR